MFKNGTLLHYLFGGNEIYFSLLHANNCFQVRVLMVASMRMTDFWDVAPCSLVEIDRRLRGAYCLLPP
jgi:hypothetical protein